jgi:hypothetical protein
MEQGAENRWSPPVVYRLDESLLQEVTSEQGRFEFIQKHAGLTGRCVEPGPDTWLSVRCCVEGGRFDKHRIHKPDVVYTPPRLTGGEPWSENGRRGA